MTLQVMTRPRRLQWLFSDHAIYYITFCTQDRRYMLDRKIVHETFIKFCRAASCRNIVVGRYVIMPDHIHLFAAFGIDSPSASSWIKSLKNTISKASPPHWQK